MPISAPSDHVVRVLLNRAYVKMNRVKTTSNVAMVKDIHAFRDQFPGMDKSTRIFSNLPPAVGQSGSLVHWFQGVRVVPPVPTLN